MNIKIDLKEIGWEDTDSTSTEAKIGGGYTSIPPYVFIVG
jgi:hypothetical protein